MEQLLSTRSQPNSFAVIVELWDFSITGQWMKRLCGKREHPG